MPTSYPDYPKLLRAIGRIWGWFMLAFLTLLVVCLVLGVPVWAFAGAAAALAAGGLVAAAREGRSWGEETKARRQGGVARDLPTGRAATVGQPPPRRVPWLWIAFNVITALGLPIAIVGATTGHESLSVVGLVLLGLFVIDTAIIWPLRRVRRSAEAKRDS